MRITEFNELWTAVNRLKIDRVAYTEIKEFEEKGLDTSLNDVFDVYGGELVTIMSDGSIRKAIVHISDISNWKAQWIERGLPKYHIFECQTLIQMRANNRKHRYKKAGRTDGKFWIILPKDSEFKKLKICGYCLSEYNKNYDAKVSKDSFEISEYLKQKINHLQPYITQEEDMTTVPRAYSSDWSKISNYMKTSVNYVCQECYKDLSNHRKYIQTHHIDADRSNNNQGNLKVLCIECHSREYNHSHIKNTPLYQEYIYMKDSI